MYTPTTHAADCFATCKCQKIMEIISSSPLFMSTREHDQEEIEEPMATTYKR
jgi:hypothetical protein